MAQVAEVGSRKHPKGLMVLFFTEMWERFGFYLMIGIFLLYMTDSNAADGFVGMEFSYSKAAQILGTYLALVYLTPFFGGIIADRKMGYRNAITLGGLLMSAGYFGLAIKGEAAFYISLLLIILGNGFFKPNISALLGKLYDDPQYSKNKDSGYNIFYLGINIGAFICNLVAAYMRINYGWGWAFASAGIGMLLGLLIFWIGQNFVAPDIKAVDKISPPKPGDVSLGSILLMPFAPAIGAALLGWFIPGNIFGSDTTDAFLFFCLPVVWFYVSLVRKASPDEKEPLKALLATMGVVVVFWAVFHQNSSALTKWAEEYTGREIPTWLDGTMVTLNMNQEVTTDLREVQKTDLHNVPILDAQGKPIVEMAPDPYFRNLPKEEWPASGKLNLFSSELFQSINPGFIVIFTPLIVGFLGWLRVRGKEPSTPAKIALGLFITALSTLVMVVAAVVSGNGEIKVSAGWLFGSYAVITVGELFLSPMGLSLVSKLAPQRMVALMMGGWFLSTSIGNKLSGVLAELWDFYDTKALFFLTNGLLVMIAVVGIFFLLPWLRRVVEEHTK